MCPYRVLYRNGILSAPHIALLHRIGGRLSILIANIPDKKPHTLHKTAVSEGVRPAKQTCEGLAICLPSPVLF